VTRTNVPRTTAISLYVLRHQCRPAPHMRKMSAAHGGRWLCLGTLLKGPLLGHAT
jgi:hypothetical protein